MNKQQLYFIGGIVGTLLFLIYLLAENIPAVANAIWIH